MPLNKGSRPGPPKPMGKVLRKGPPTPPAAPLLRPLKVNANLQRAKQQEVRRQAVRQIANQRPIARPRPVVRPAAPPLKVMPKAPRPAPPPATRLDPRRTALRTSGMAAGVAVTAAGLVALNASRAHTDIATETQALQSVLDELQERSTFGRMQSDIASLDTLINRVVELLESARDKGYCYQADLEDLVYNTVSDWQRIEPEIAHSAEQFASGMAERIPELNPQVQRLNSSLHNATLATPILRTTQTQVNAMLQEVSRLENELTAAYEPVATQARQLDHRLTQIHWALDQLAGAKFKLADQENLVMAVPTRLDREGKDDPEGVLYLSDKRLVFERKEKVATKKVLFITTASELVQEVLIDQALAAIKSVKAENKGLFGHQDFILVEFSDAKLGAVSLHIDGQKSEDWAVLLRRAQSGELATDKVNQAGGLSLKDLTRPITTADIMALQGEVNALQDEMMLKETRQEIADLENDVRGLERKLADLRAQGYLIEKDLEADIAVLSIQWDRVKTNAEATVNHQTQLLAGQMTALQQSMARLAGMTGNLVAARPVYMQVKSALASAEAQADAAESTVQAQFDEYADEIESLHAHLDWVGWMLEALATASFRLLATESGVAAVEAIFQHDQWEPENGILFLTDQRLLWEDRVGDYELKVNLPIQEIQDIRKQGDEQTGQEVLFFRIGAQGPLPEARFILGQPVADDWLRMVGRARSGGYAQDRAVPISEAELERVRSAPQQCSNCGAAFTAPILRGQTELVCEYCGVVARI